MQLRSKEIISKRRGKEGDGDSDAYKVRAQSRKSFRESMQFPSESGSADQKIYAKECPHREHDQYREVEVVWIAERVKCVQAQWLREGRPKRVVRQDVRFVRRRNIKRKEKADYGERYEKPHVSSS